MGAFLWEDPDQDFWSVVFLSGKSIFRSVIHRIHSGQGFIGSLIWVIWRPIIGSMIRHVHLERGSEINPCAQRFSLCKRESTSYMGCFSRVYKDCDCCGNWSWFSHISACIVWNSSENGPNASELRVVEKSLVQKFSVLPPNCQITFWTFVDRGSMIEPWLSTLFVCSDFLLFRCMFRFFF